MNAPDSELREALRRAAAAAGLATPVGHSELLQMIVEAAAHVIGARGGSLLLVDEGAEELVFEVAVGAEAPELSGMRIPLGEGIAGLVAVTGHPMALSDARGDPRVSDDVSRTIGYVPDALLCVPLEYDDRVIGVLELVDKRDGTTFTGADIGSLVLFANQAAVAIRQSGLHRQLALLIEQLLAPESGNGAPPTGGEHEDDDAYRGVVELSELVREIAGHGEHAAKACSDILQSFAGYLRSQPRSAKDL